MSSDSAGRIWPAARRLPTPGLLAYNAFTYSVSHSVSYFILPVTAMRVPTCIIGVKMVALMDLANIFFLDTWGTEEAKRKWLETKGDLPIFFGVEAHVPPDLANIQVRKRRGGEVRSGERGKV